MFPPADRFLRYLGISLLIGMMSGCGGAGSLTSPSPIRDKCPSEDVYLADFYALVDQGKLNNISAVLSEELSYDLQSDLAVALIHLVGWVPAGTFEGLQALDAAVESDETMGPELAIVTRWVAQNGPNAPYLEQFSAIRGMLETCPGESTLRLVSALLKDSELMSGGGGLLSSLDLEVLLAEFELEDEKGRSAVKALFRNLLAALASPDFDVDALLDIVGLLLDLEEGPGVEFRGLLENFLADGDKRDALVALVKCLQASDPDLKLIDLLYDLLTDDALAVTQLFESPPVREGAPQSETASKTLPVILEGLAGDLTVRRGVSKVLGLLLHPDHSTGVLMDVANVLEAELLDDFVKLAAAYATKSCE